MAVKISIIGLGQIGSSIGLALANHKDQVAITGHDKSPKTAQKAQKMGAVEKIAYNLPASVKEADVILLALPVDQIYDTLKVIAQDVREDAVVMDTALVKSAVAAWTKELLPPRRHYVGLTPTFGPRYLEEANTGIEGAHADLFQHSLMGISTLSGTSGEAVQLAIAFATLLGAEPYFTDLAEIDGIMSTAHLLPQLAEAALINATITQPGWSDIRKMAGRHFAVSTMLVASQKGNDSLSELVLHNRENVVHALDSLLAATRDLRDKIAKDDKKGLAKWLEHARQGRAKWWAERSSAGWLEVEFGRQALPTAKGIWKQQIGGLDRLFGLRREPRKKLDDD